MATLTNTKIKDTYDGLLKTTDNDVIGASEKVITDGLGNASVLSIGTASASFSSDIEVNTLTIGKGANDVSTNTALGYQTLENATGGGNTAVGYGGLLYTTTGVQNTAVGLTALENNTTGSYNTALGSITLDVNTEGDNNVAVGYRSLSSNTTGNSNVAVGSQALSTQTIGSFSTAVGYEALMSQTTGSNNTAIGYASMRTSTTGTYNVAVGVASLYDNTTGSTNVAIGRYALTNNVSGDSNVGIGTNSGNQLTTGSNNIYIGNTAVGSAADNDNEIVIGASATGNGSNTATYGNASITDHYFTSGTVRINSDSLRLTGATNPQVLVTDTTNSVSVGLQALDASTKIESTHSFKTSIANNIIHSVTSSGVEITGNLAVGGTGVFTNTLRTDNILTVGDSTTVGTKLIQVTPTSTSTPANIQGIHAGVGAYDITLQTSGGNVGIGTSPIVPLTLKGELRIQDTTATTGTKIGYDNASSLNFQVYNYQSGNIEFGTSGAEAMRIDSSGNVGIGTQSPAAVLEVNNDTDGETVAIFEGRYAAVSDVTLASFQRNGGAVAAAVKYADASTAIEFGTTTGHSLILTTGDTERMRIDSSGNVGIGTSTMSAKFQIGDGSASVFQTIDSSNGGSLNFKKSGTASAFVGEVQQGLGSGDGLLLYTYSGADRPIRFYTAGSERMRITSGGFLKASNNGVYGSSTALYHEVRSNRNDSYIARLDNTATSNGGFAGINIRYTGISPDANSNEFLLCEDSTAIRMRVYSDGDVWTSDAGTLTSDETLKTNITDATSKLGDVMNLRVRNYYWKEDYHPEKIDKKLIGFVAQEFEQVFPHLVSEHKIKEEELAEDGTVIQEAVYKKGIKEGKLIPILVKAMQEQQEIINDLKARIETLEAK